MKKLTKLLALALVFLAVITQGAYASDALGGLPITSQDADAISALIAQFGSELSGEEVQALLQEIFSATTGAPTTGTLEGDLYTHTAGFSLRVPQGWRVLEPVFGTAVALGSPVEPETQFMSTVTVQVLTQPQQDFFTMKPEEISALMSQSLKNYQFVQLEDFQFLNVPAREFVCAYGEDEASMLIQYQLMFNANNKAFLLTLTTRAAETSHDAALAVYDAVLDSFTLQ